MVHKTTLQKVTHYDIYLKSELSGYMKLTKTLWIPVKRLN